MAMTKIQHVELTKMSFNLKTAHTEEVQGRRAVPHLQPGTWRIKLVVARGSRAGGGPFLEDSVSDPGGQHMRGDCWRFAQRILLPTHDGSHETQQRLRVGSRKV
jgi:hypothetical protein